MKPNNRITYRFDVPESKQPEKDKPERRMELIRERELTPYEGGAGQATSSNNKVVPLYQQPTSNVIDDAQPWHNAYQEDIGALEQLIREATPDRETADEGGERMERMERVERTERMELVERGDEDAPVAKGSDEQWIPIQAEAMLLQPAKGSSEPAMSDRWLATGEEGVLEHRTVPALHESAIATGSEYAPRQGDLIWEGGATRTPAVSRRPGGKGPSWLHVFLSVGGALATGAIFGYLILSLFTGASFWPNGEETATGEDSPAVQPDTRDPIGLDDLSGAPQTGDKETAGNEPSVPAATVNVSSLARTYTLLQFGLFSNAEGRDAAVKQLRDGGLAAASTKTAEGYRVYAGIATDGGKAVLIGSGLPDVLLYKKEVALQAPERLPFGGGADAALAFFASSNDLVSAWSDLVVAQLEQPSLSPLGSVAAEGWKTRYEQWTAHAAAMEEGLSDAEGGSYFAKLRAAIDQAAASMTEYDKNPSKAHLWATESALMEAVLVQKEWFESTSAL